jgi:hypothetical protein
MNYSTAEDKWVSRKVLSMRDRWRHLEARGVRMSFYIPHFDDDADEYADVMGFSEGSIDRLHGRYRFRDEISVKNFLRENQFLVDLLYRASIKVRKYFGPSSPILKVVKDPEVGEDQRLFVLIETEMRPDDALDQLDDLYEHWWLDVLPEAKHKMSIDVEYV